MTRFLLVCLGGAIGTGIRYLTSLWALQVFGAVFPFGTLIVNVVGSFLLASIVELAASGFLSADARLILGAGFLGGLTTYSTFNFETLALSREGNISTAVIYATLTIAGCLAAGLAGIALARFIARSV